MQKIKIFIFNKIIGLFLLAIFCFSSISLLSRTLEDPYFGNINSVNDIGNYFGVFGSYFAGTAYTFFGNISYIIPFFFLITGFRKTIGIRTNFLLIRLFSFVISLCLFSLILKFWLNQGGILGSFLLNIINFHFEDYLANKVIFLFLFVLFIFISIFLLFYSLSLNLRITSLLLSPFIKILVFILRFFKLSYLLAFVKTIFNLRKKLKIKSANYKQNINHNNNIKKEPTLLADKVKNMGLGLINDGKRLSKTSINEYIIPSLSLLTTLPKKNYYSKEIEKHNEINARKLESILEDFGVIGKINNFKTGPIITIFEFQPSPGVKTSKVVGLATDIARSMSSMSARISSQPGKNSIGIEIPNDKKQDVYLGDLLNDEKFEQSRKGLILALGKSISGEKVYTDLERMPHLLIAGTTGSGKSVGINSMILSLLFRFKPSECKLILIDPKVLELSIYENIPHLLTPVVTDPKKAIFALKWVVREMENRYRLMNSASVKNIKSFNNKITSYLSRGKKLYREIQTGFAQDTKMPIIEKQEIPLEHMPLIVVVIDEMADLMMVAGKEVEYLVQRLAQMARASGIHLIAATQRPSVDVITGTIKANFPSRISYRVASKFDSRTILNEMGAEQLLGSGDMLFLENGANLMRLHGGYISEKEINNVVSFINSQSTNETQTDITIDTFSKDGELNFNEQSANVDELYSQAVSIVLQHQKASTSFVQRHLQIGYNRAARIIEQMEKEGVITEANHVGKRSVLKKNN